MLMIAIQIHTFVLCNLTVLFPIYVMGASLQCDYVSKGTFSSGVLLLDFFLSFSFSLELVILHSTNREADEVQLEQKVEGNQGWPIRLADR